MFLGGGLSGFSAMFLDGPSFNGWLPGKRMSTMDRLQTWMVIDINRCVSCSAGPEKHGHLFFWVSLLFPTLEANDVA